jgi:hypothetical protein
MNNFGLFSFFLPIDSVLPAVVRAEFDIGYYLVCFKLPIMALSLHFKLGVRFSRLLFGGKGVSGKCYY